MSEKSTADCRSPLGFASVLRINRASFSFIPLNPNYPLHVMLNAVKHLHAGLVTWLTMCQDLSFQSR
jgi:hypothetical protein